MKWFRPCLGLTTEDLAPLFNLLSWGEELDSPGALTQKTPYVLEKLESAQSSRQAHHCQPDLPFNFIILGKLPYLHRLIFQWDSDQKDPLLIIRVGVPRSSAVQNYHKATGADGPADQ